MPAHTEYHHCPLGSQPHHFIHDVRVDEEQTEELTKV